MGYTTDRIQRLGAVDDTQTFSPSVVLNLRFGWTFFQAWQNPAPTGVNLADFGLGSLTNLSSTPKAITLPFIQISGYTNYMQNIGEGQSFSDDHKIYTGAATLNYMRASHMLSFGAEYRHYIENYLSDFADALAAFLLGSRWNALCRSGRPADQIVEHPESSPPS